VKSHAQAVAVLQGKPRQTRKARARREDGVGSQPRYVRAAWTHDGVTIPLRLISEANVSQREHWATKHKRVKRVHEAVQNALPIGRKYRPALPCAITITRIAPRALDAHDNLPRSCKAVVDSIAEWLGVDDSDPRITWAYAQERGEPWTYGVRVQWRAAA
jgi:hypothetical protein